jgi:allantoinase
VITPDGERAATVHVADGRIERVAPLDEVPGDRPLVDAGDLVVVPGVVDTHVHVNEPGRTAWEGFETATRAAAAGGVTTILDMPLNSIPPTTSPEALDAKRSAAEASASVDVGFWGGAIPDDLGSLRALHEAGVFGLKCFLCPSGVDEFPPLDLEQVRSAMREIAAFDGLLVVHAEAPELLRHDVASTIGGGDYHSYLSSRPPEAEEAAVAAVADASRATGCRTHVLHLSAIEALEPLVAARDAGVPISAETCTHYLTFEAERIRDGATEYKCAPPIRGATNRAGLWEALGRGAIDAVVSDHSPCVPELKAGSFLEAWGGIASLELGLRAVWTEARMRGHSLSDVARWMSAGPAGLAGLERKGSIAPGMDADLVLFDPDAGAEVVPTELHQHHPVTPYAGRRLDGRVAATYVRGVEVFSNGAFPVPPSGRLLRRGSA